MPVSASMVAANVFIDDFNRADGSVGSNYQAVSGSSLFQIISNQVRVNITDRAQLNCVSTGSVIFNANHESQVTFGAVVGSDLASPAVRIDPTNGTGYIIFLDTFAASGRRISTLAQNVRTSIGNVNLSATAGDIWKLQANGNVITAYRNGVVVDSVTNNTYTSGQPGLFYSRGNVGGTRMDNFIAADIPTTNAKSLCIISQTPVGNLIVGSQ